MKACVIDASVAIKWVITEEGTDAANRLRWGGTVFHAPDLIVPEAGNILWKKMLRGELPRDEAELACSLLELAKTEIHAMGPVASLALARTLDIQMVTADRRLGNKVVAMANAGSPALVLLS
jgi:predicted nucleic acid-binding protein